MLPGSEKNYMSVDRQAAYFLDTNILIFAYDRSAGKKHDLAAQMVESCWENENGCLSIQVLQEFFVTVTDLAQWRIHTPKASDLLEAIDLQQSYQLAFWDALVVQSAASLGCKQLFSEDLNHDQVYGDVQVINPFREMH
jgi:predicted nucleic acid-binding protein